MTDTPPLPTISAKVDMIDPARATSLLAKSKGNRPLRLSHIRWLAQQMRSGQWKLTHQGIALSVTERLLDGHHRLEAVKLSGATVPLLMLRGFPDDTWESIDCGVVRAVHDRIALHDDSVVNRRVVEVIQQLMRIEDCHKGRMSTEDVTKQWADLRKALTVIFNIAPKPIKGITRAPVLGAIARYHQRYEKGAIDFMRRLVEPHPLANDNSPARVLSRWLVDSSGFNTGGAALATQLYWTTVGMITLHFRGFASTTTVERATKWWDAA